MKHSAHLFATSLLLVLPSVAQEGGKPPAPAADSKAPAQAKPAERPKDDAVTAKDPAIVEIDKFIADKGPTKKEDKWRVAMAKPPKLTFSADVTYEWHIKTNKGPLTVKLLPEVAPMHVSSTIYLARTGFYDTLIFHRVIPGFMAQGGDPLGAGSGGPGYQYDGEFDPKVTHSKPGLLSMANRGPGTDGSQFFLTFVPTPHLDGKHTIFGEVTGGMETLKALEAAGSRTGATSEKLVMEMSWIVVTPKAEKKAEEPKK
jgi:peptidyl-prolyl cis-trans isomerase B (cyclophilin B)